MSSYSYVLFRNVSLSLNPDTLWKKEAEGVTTTKRGKERPAAILFWNPWGSYLQTLDGGEEREGQGEGGSGAELAQLSS